MSEKKEFDDSLEQILEVTKTSAALLLLNQKH